MDIRKQLNDVTTELFSNGAKVLRGKLDGNYASALRFNNQGYLTGDILKGESGTFIINGFSDIDKKNAHMPEYKPSKPFRKHVIIDDNTYSNNVPRVNVINTRTNEASSIPMDELSNYKRLDRVGRQYTPAEFAKLKKYVSDINNELGSGHIPLDKTWEKISEVKNISDRINSAAGTRGYNPLDNIEYKSINDRIEKVIHNGNEYTYIDDMLKIRKNTKGMKTIYKPDGNIIKTSNTKYTPSKSYSESRHFVHSSYDDRIVSATFVDNYNNIFKFSIGDEVKYKYIDRFVTGTITDIDSKGIIKTDSSGMFNTYRELTKTTVYDSVADSKKYDGIFKRNYYTEPRPTKGSVYDNYNAHKYNSSYFDRVKPRTNEYKDLTPRPTKGSVYSNNSYSYEVPTYINPITRRTNDKVFNRQRPISDSGNYMEDIPETVFEPYNRPEFNRIVKEVQETVSGTEQVENETSKPINDNTQQPVTSEESKPIPEQPQTEQPIQPETNKPVPEQPKSEQISFENVNNQPIVENKPETKINNLKNRRTQLISEKLKYIKEQNGGVYDHSNEKIKEFERQLEEVENEIKQEKRQQAKNKEIHDNQNIENNDTTQNSQQPSNTESKPPKPEQTSKPIPEKVNESIYTEEGFDKLTKEFTNIGEEYRNAKETGVTKEQQDELFKKFNSKDAERRRYKEQLEKQQQIEQTSSQPIIENKPVHEQPTPEKTSKPIPEQPKPEQTSKPISEQFNNIEDNKAKYDPEKSKRLLKEIEELREKGGPENQIEIFKKYSEYKKNEELKISNNIPKNEKIKTETLSKEEIEKKINKLTHEQFGSRIRQDTERVKQIDEELAKLKEMAKNSDNTNKTKKKMPKPEDIFDEDELENIPQKTNDSSHSEENQDSKIPESESEPQTPKTEEELKKEAEEEAKRKQAEEEKFNREFEEARKKEFGERLEKAKGKYESAVNERNALKQEYDSISRELSNTDPLDTQKINNLLERQKRKGQELKNAGQKVNQTKFEMEDARGRYNTRDLHNVLENEINFLGAEEGSLSYKIDETTTDIANSKQNIKELEKQMQEGLNNGKDVSDLAEIINNEYNNLETFTDDLANNKKRLKEVQEKRVPLKRYKKNKFGENVYGGTPRDVLKKKLLPGAINAYFTISTYKDKRREGHGVASSALSAGASFVMGEILGPAALIGTGLLSTVPSLAVKGGAAAFTEMRRMNTASRYATFGEANFQDSQQLATMRQSGMELAKMSQYRLEQALMGAEARYLHK